MNIVHSESLDDGGPWEDVQENKMRRIEGR